VLTGEFEDVTDDQTDETPTFGIVDDGRTYPAVTVRRRQHQGSKRETLYTISKFGGYKALYDQFAADVIEPYRERKRQRTQGRADTGVNSTNIGTGGNDTQSPSQGNQGNPFGFPVNSVD